MSASPSSGNPRKLLERESELAEERSQAGARRARPRNPSLEHRSRSWRRRQRARRREGSRRTRREATRDGKELAQRSRKLDTTQAKVEESRKELQALRARMTELQSAQKADQRRAHDLANQAGKLETKLKSALLKLEEQTARAAEIRRDLATARKEATAATRRAAKAESALERAKSGGRNGEPVKELTPRPRPAEEAAGADGKKPTPRKRATRKKAAKKPSARSRPADDLKLIAGIGRFEGSHKAGVRGWLRPLQVADLGPLREDRRPRRSHEKGKWVEREAPRQRVAARRLTRPAGPPSRFHASAGPIEGAALAGPRERRQQRSASSRPVSFLLRGGLRNERGPGRSERPGPRWSTGVDRPSRGTSPATIQPFARDVGSTVNVSSYIRRSRRSRPRCPGAEHRAAADRPDREVAQATDLAAEPVELSDAAALAAVRVLEPHVEHAAGVGVERGWRPAPRSSSAHHRAVGEDTLDHRRRGHVDLVVDTSRQVDDVFEGTGRERAGIEAPTGEPSASSWINCRHCDPSRRPCGHRG